MRHVLVIHEPGVDWSVEHNGDCPAYESEGLGLPCDGPQINYECGVAHEISHVGLDSLDVDWTTLPRGRYEIENWSRYYPNTGDYDGGLNLLCPTSSEEEPHV